jgi:hypothetical protein
MFSLLIFGGLVLSGLPGIPLRFLRFGRFRLGLRLLAGTAG